MLTITKFDHTYSSVNLAKLIYSVKHLTCSTILTQIYDLKIKDMLFSIDFVVHGLHNCKLFADCCCCNKLIEQQIKATLYQSLKNYKSQTFLTVAITKAYLNYKICIISLNC